MTVGYGSVASSYRHGMNNYTQARLTRAPFPVAAARHGQAPRHATNMPMRLLLLLAALCWTPPVLALQPTAPFHVEQQQLDAQYWIDRHPAPETPLLAPGQIAAFNANLLRKDPSVHDLHQLPDAYAASEIRAWIARLSAPPTRTLYDEQGQPLAAERLAALAGTLDLDAIPERVAPRYGLVVRRADLRAFPTGQRVFSSPDDTDIDRFQESGLYPGTPVAVLHRSRDGRWLFVVSPNYAAWIESGHVAIGEREEVLDYARRQPRLIVTGAQARTVFTPERPSLSSLPLDMGVQLPVLHDWPQNIAVNGQLPYTAHVVQLPVRNEDGSLQFGPALVPRSADVATGPLPATPANLLRQAFKFLGERYGWGHSYEARDCSGFVLDVYRSLGIDLPRNTIDQSRSPALESVPYDASAPLQERLGALARLQAGDLVYIPGHVMMVIGHDNGQTWVIHDTAGASYRDAGGQLHRARINAVAVTPLEPLLLGSGEAFIDRITRIQRIPPQGLP